MGKDRVRVVWAGTSRPLPAQKRELERLLGKGMYDLVMYPISKADLQNVENTVTVFREDLGADIVIVFGNMGLLAPLIDAFLRGGIEVWFSKTDMIHVEDEYGGQCPYFDPDRDILVHDGRRTAHKRFAGYYLVHSVITLNAMSRLALVEIENSRYVGRGAGVAAPG
jgi:hypothetical protein